MPVRELVSEFVKEAPPYVVGAEEQSKKKPDNVKELIQLATNENPFGISPKAVEAMQQQATICNRYPDVRAKELRAKLATVCGVSAEQVMVTDGATQGLNFIGEVFLRPGDEAIVTPPTYPNYYNIIKRMQAKLVEVPLTEATLTPDFDKVMAAVTPKTKLIFLCNPNNPTGTLIPSAELHAFAQALPRHVVLVVDEAYLDFVEDPSYKNMVDAVSDDTNVIVVRTFSKMYGMAGARIGYLISNVEIVNYLQRDATGFCTNRPALYGALAALDDKEFLDMSVAMTKKARAFLAAEMHKHGFTVWESHANFIYFDPLVDVQWFADQMLRFGLIIRGNFPKNRISVGTMEQDAIVAHAFDEICASDEYKARLKG